MAQYYPKSQIIPNQYTGGEEYVLSTTLEVYIGDYYATSNGENFTGKGPGDGENILIIPNPTLPNPNDTQSDAATPSDQFIVLSTLINPNVDIGNNDYGLIEDYLNLRFSKNQKRRKLPQTFSPNPSLTDYKNEEFQRYFCKKNTELLFIEINSQTFIDLSTNSPLIASEMYTAFQIPWSLTGSSEKEVYSINKKIVFNIEKSNNLYGFSSFFNDNFSKYYSGLNKLVKNSITYTKGGEFLFPNRTNYIGYYHQMENGNYMTGKYHGEGNDILLIPLNNINISISPSPTPQTSTQSTSSPSPTTSGGGGGY